MLPAHFVRSGHFEYLVSRQFHQEAAVIADTIVRPDRAIANAKFVRDVEHDVIRLYVLDGGVDQGSVAKPDTALPSCPIVNAVKPTV